MSATAKFELFWTVKKFLNSSVMSFFNYPCMNCRIQREINLFSVALEERVISAFWLPNWSSWTYDLRIPSISSLKLSPEYMFSWVREADFTMLVEIWVLYPFGKFTNCRSELQMYPALPPTKCQRHCFARNSCKRCQTSHLSILLSVLTTHSSAQSICSLYTTSCHQGLLICFSSSLAMLTS